MSACYSMCKCARPFQNTLAYGYGNSFIKNNFVHGRMVFFVCLFVCLWGAQNQGASYVDITLMSVLLLWFFFVISYFFFLGVSKFYFFMCFYFSYKHILFRIWFLNMFFNLFLIIYFTIVDLQCYVNFWCMARWLSYTYIFFFIFFSIRIFKIN